ncbi:hypothetical protein [Aureispira anguillae]|uniref:Uncharacterized protein n=1 Tax=Aureispira anguillae TaxID=2864201 RepID=A0A915Y9W6_9BACT|nr:hypothetical protein [Aureispira anguillae]BDS09554.1 hypothetical protein AsAng_0002550 [Aureispira anguillae]
MRCLENDSKKAHRQTFRCKNSSKYTRTNTFVLLLKVPTPIFNRTGIQAPKITGSGDIKVHLVKQLGEAILDHNQL